MAEQNGVRNAAEGGNDKNGHHAGPFHNSPRVLRQFLDLERPPTPANGLNLEEGVANEGLMVRMFVTTLLRALVMLFRQEGERLMKILEHCVLKNLRVKKKKKSFPFFKKMRKMFCQTLRGKGLMLLVIKKFLRTQRCLSTKGLWRLCVNFALVLLICPPPLNR
jgi:hypothetical protein